MKYYVFFLDVVQHTKTFESHADLVKWLENQPDTVEISLIVHGMEVDPRQIVAKL